MIARNLKLLVTLLVLALSTAFAQGNIVRMVTWQPKPGMSRDFDEGYKRHLQWHGDNRDPWTWHGWTIISGDRNGWFVDATFDHQWTDFDAPVAPAADAADNQINVYPYADVRQVSTYEIVAPATNLKPQELASTLLTFTRFHVRPGSETQFESAVSIAFQKQQIPHALLRPADGTTAYLLLIPASRTSQLGTTGEVLRQVKSSIGSDSAAIQSIHTETARYRSALSYIPK